jgi:hypothetical protein
MCNIMIWFSIKLWPSNLQLVTKEGGYLNTTQSVSLGHVEVKHETGQMHMRPTLKYTLANVTNAIR